MADKLYIINAFSAQMLGDMQRTVRVDFIPFDNDEVRVFLNGRRDENVVYKSSIEERGTEVVSAVGHADTARVFGEILERDIPCNRISISLEKGDVCLLGQLSGGRLPEGATSLPEGYKIKWLLVRPHYYN